MSGKEGVLCSKITVGEDRVAVHKGTIMVVQGV